MRKVIHLRFSADVESEEEAWDICERLEEAAMRQDFVAVSTWLESDSDRPLVPEGSAAQVSEATRVERSPGNKPTGVGDAEGVLVPSVWGQEE